MRFKNLISAAFVILLFFNVTTVHSIDMRVYIQNIETEYLKILRAAYFDHLDNNQDYILNRAVDVAPSCVAFLDGQNRLGQSGLFTVNEIVKNSKDYPDLLNSTAMIEACPNFLNLSTDNKAIIITLLLTTMAHFESSCRPGATNNGPNGIAKGLFQLHLGSEAYYDGSDDACVKNASLNPNLSIRCTLGMLNRQFEKTDKLFYEKSYWDVLRPQGEAQSVPIISRALSNSSLCHR